MDQEIRFCTSPDGVSIAYGWSGKGPPLVQAASYLRHLEFDWLSPVWRHWHEELNRDHTCIRYDERGSGLSDWNADDLSFEAWVTDLETIVNTVGLERFPLFAMSQGGTVAVAYAARHPEKISKLILFGAYARGWLNRNLTAEQMQEEEVMISLMQVGWGRDNPAFRQFFTNQIMPDATPEQMHWYNDLMRISATPENAVRLEKEMHRTDVSELAPKVKAPTLIFHARHDEVVPFEEGRLLAKLIPNAHFVPLESKNHLLQSHEPAWFHFVREFRKFMGVETGKEAPERSTTFTNPTAGQFQSTRQRLFAAVLFTDIVESTSQQRSYGDRAWLELLDQLNSELSRLSMAYDGRVVKFTGDGLMAVFPTAGSALEAAAEMVKAAQALNLEIRSGVHAGEVLQSDDDFSGTVVTIASRVMGQAQSGEIMTTDVVRGLVEGSDLVFVDHGQAELKGVGQRRLYGLVIKGAE